MVENYYIYIMASRPNGAIYIGVTNNIAKRIYEHRQSKSGHTAKYKIHKLVYFEIHASTEEAILRENRLKKWTRAMKNDLISSNNPLWEDLYTSII